MMIWMMHLVVVTPILFDEDGQSVCRNCGMVHGNAFVSIEKRAYTADEVKNRRRTEPRWRSYGPANNYRIEQS